MDLFGRFRKLDSSLQRGLDNGFARVFGGEVVPAEIDELLKQEVEDTLMEDRTGTVYAPSSYQVHLSEHDHAALLEKRPDLANELRGRLQRFIRNEGWDSHHPVAVELVKDEGLHTGQLKARSSFEKTEQPEPHWPRSEPDSGRNPVAHSYDADEPPRPADPNPLVGLARSTQSPRTTQQNPEPDEPVQSYPGTEVISHNVQPPANNADEATGAANAPAGEELPRTTVTLYLQDGSARSFVLQHGTNVIGRGNAVDFRLPDTGVSRQHAEITWDGYDAVLTDLKSTNGTTVNEIPVESWLLADGDVITIGHSEMDVRFS
jgi:pSer/pThr/pTyr-binding forkhead associated (FHA) protein